ncbi:MAG: hypothetical protein CSA34_06235 [Desulfobulbus propionicus]|nr:MAG: hypothetical protein CSA34_06235 [Desulfobulbus propionicus]
MEHEIVIKKIIPGGSGLGHLNDGKVCLVDHVLPGEAVRVQTTSCQRGYDRGVVSEIIEASPLRVRPPCPWYGSCGGCDFQHIDPVAQLHIKEEILRETLTRQGPAPALPALSSALPSPALFGYRHRLLLHVDRRQRLGLYRAGSNQVVEIEHCAIVTPGINRVLAALRDNDAPGLPSWCRNLEILQSPADGRTFLVLHRRGHRQGRIPERFTAWACGVVNGLFCPGTFAMDDAPAELRQRFCFASLDYQLHWNPGCFFQSNARHNENLVELAVRLAGNIDDTRVLDLFCGMGNFSVPLALSGARVTGIEHNHHAIARARDNTARLAVHARFLATDTAAFLDNPTGTSFDFVLLDPPRAGLTGGADSARALAALGAHHILYISCDPATLGRDLKLLHTHRYQMVSVNLVDMFPHTHHIEAVVLLEKN